MKDWTGNNKSIYSTLGASNHSENDRALDDYYATHPSAADHLLKLLPDINDIWEPACGEGHLAKVFDDAGKLSRASDLINRGYGEGDVDFLALEGVWDGDIITNPPYKYAKEFVEKSIQTITDGHYCCMFLKLQFLEGQKRRPMFERYPLKHLFVSSSRIMCAPNGDFKNVNSSAVAYGWFVWQKGYAGEPTIRWFN